jgi:hypothetical protein
LRSTFVKEYKSQKHRVLRELILVTDILLKLRQKAKTNGKSEGTDYRPLMYLAGSRLLHPMLLSGDERGEIMRLRSSGGQSPADIHSTSDKILRIWDPQVLQQTAGALVLMNL